MKSTFLTLSILTMILSLGACGAGAVEANGACSDKLLDEANAAVLQFNDAKTVGDLEKARDAATSVKRKYPQTECKAKFKGVVKTVNVDEWMNEILFKADQALRGN